MIEGSCLCGGIRFEVNTEHVYLVNNCFCSRCRKASGSGYGTFVQVRAEGFRWVQGEDLVGIDQSTRESRRAFCTVCGSRAPQSQDFTLMVTVPAGSLGPDFDSPPQMNMFTASAPAWVQIDESIPTAPDQGTPRFWKALIKQLGTNFPRRSLGETLWLKLKSALGA